jgi:hypothetical protein
MLRSYQPLLWAQLADQARAAAKQVKDPAVKLRVLLIAARYLAWAKQAESDTTVLHRRESQRGLTPHAASPEND